MKSKFFVFAAVIAIGVLISTSALAWHCIMRGDTDHDEVCNDVDDCPSVAGPEINGGCPLEPPRPLIDESIRYGRIGTPDFSRPDMGDPIADTDHDGESDDEDNCPSVANAGQEDTDADGIGDACDSDVIIDDSLPIDTDGDLVADVDDLCADTPAGAAVNEWGCPDTDADGLYDDVDNCVAEENADQIDTDGDGIGDACDTDSVSTGSGCSLVQSANGSAVLSALIFAISLAPLTIRRKLK